MLRRFFLYNFGLVHRFTSGFQRRVSAFGKILLSVLGGAAIFGINTHEAATYQLFSLLAALFALSMFWHFLLRRQRLPIAAERHLPPHATVGEPLRYTLSFIQTGTRIQRGLSVLDWLAGGYPAWEEFRDATEPGASRRNAFDRYMGFYTWQWLLRNKRGASLEERALPDLAPNQRVTVPLELTPLRRGRLQFAELCLHRSDPFGLLRSVQILPLPQSCCVLPRCHPVSPLPQEGGRAYQRGGVALANSVGDSEEFLSLREYRQGDPLRKVHWRSSARYGRWVVKEFQDEYFVRRALVLDTFCPPQRAEDFEAAVSAAASLALGETGRDALLDLMFVEHQAHCFTAGRGLAHAVSLLEVLAGVQPSRQTEFAVLSGNVLQRAGTLSSVACVLLDWDEPRRKLCSHLAGLGLPVAVLLVRAEAPDPSAGAGLFLRHVRPGHLAADLLWQ